MQQPQIILGIAAHPDDLDFMAGGSLAAFAKAGAAVHYLILTDGGKGTSDREQSSAELTRLRQTEQRAALQAIGGTDVTFLDYSDGQLEVTMDLKRDIVRAIRRVRPDMVVTIDPSMLYSAANNFINHPDHRAAGQAALDAVYPLARDHLSFPELLDEGLQPHKTASILLCNYDQANHYIDIGGTIDQKLAALAAHASQMTDMAAVEAIIRGQAEAAGKLAGDQMTLAEGFVRIDIPA